MTDHRPGGVHFETWLDRQIRDAADRGEFDNLPGAGKPLPGAGNTDDENWWLRSYLQREGISGDLLLPPAVLLRREAEELPALVRKMASEADVRAAAAGLNKRIVECLRQPSDVRISVRPVNVEKIVEEWRAERPVESPPVQPDEEPAPRRRWWRRR
jgi:hypothetical protein